MTVIILCLVLYLAGVFSGLYANKVLERKTKGELRTLQDSTKRDISNLERGTNAQFQILTEYTQFLETQLSTMQLEQLFTETLSGEERCAFSSLSTQYLIDELQYYRDQLPFRVEEYEKQPDLPEEYLRLKGQYNALSIRAWIMARNVQQNCDAEFTHILYLYTADCESCVAQGEQLDEVNRRLRQEERDVLLFTIDYNADNLVLDFLKQYYNMTETPAILVDDELYQGELYQASQIIGDIS